LSVTDKYLAHYFDFGSGVLKFYSQTYGTSCY